MEISPENPGRILFVDDEENILRALRRLFMDDEYEVFVATSGADALKLLQKEKNIDVIVSDQRMPGMTGVDFLQQSRKISPESMRILLTGYADVNAAVDAINRGGAYRYITKPWRDEDLVMSVKGALQQGMLVKENKRLQAELKRWANELEAIVQEQTMELQAEYDKIKALNVRQRQNFRSTIIAFSNLIELRDKRMRSHARNVADLVGQVSEKVGIKGEEKETVVVAAVLHDIGKIGIPDIILQVHADKMNDDELEEYRQHSVRGQTVIDAIKDLQKVGLLIRHHHERYDGKGYPDGLKGSGIPLGSRLIAIADYVDKNIRKFQGTSGIEFVLQKLTEEGGKRFDPKLLAFFMEPVRAMYSKMLPKTDFIELELFPKDLEEGMILGRDVHSGTGVLLLSKGIKLDRTNIQVLKRYYDLDPSKRGVFVWIKG